MKEKENFNLRTKEPNFHNHNLPINYNLKEKIIEKKNHKCFNRWNVCKWKKNDGKTQNLQDEKIIKLGKLQGLK